MRRRRALAPCLLLVAACYRETALPDLAGQDVRLTVLHTSDLHGRMLPYYQTPGLIDRGQGLCIELQPIGGAARMQHLLRRERAKGDRVMHLDSGDDFQGAPIFNEFKGEVEMRVMAAFNPDGVVIGNHEFDLGAANVATQYARFGNGLFPLLAGNYVWADPRDPFGSGLGALVKPYEIINLGGLRVAVIGMGNTSSMTSIAQGGNSLGITPLDPVEALRAWVDTLQSEVDLIVVVSHMGLSGNSINNVAEDTQMITGYEKVVPKDAVQANWEVLNEEPSGEVRVRVPGIVGIDAIFGGHLHIVLNPPKVLEDPAGRRVVLVHSGAFAKYFGRADLMVHVPKEGEDSRYGAEIVSHSYQLFPITGRIPKRQSGDVVACPDDGSPTFESEEGRDLVDLNTQCLGVAGGEAQLELCAQADECRKIGDACTDECRAARRGCTSVPAPVDGRMLEVLDPYVQRLYQRTDLNRGFAVATGPITRFGLSGEDSPLGNLVSDAMAKRNRVEAQFAMTNTLGIRTNMEAGVVSLEEMYNIFPFENTLTTMYLSGIEVQELFDYVTERSSERGCQTQAQISGATFVMNCAQALRNRTAPACTTSADCQATEFAQLGTSHPAICKAARCFKSPADDVRVGGEPINPSESYKAAVNDFIGRGGSGFEVLRRNTTKVDTRLSLRDALIDYMRASPEDGGPGRVCGSRAIIDPPRPTRPLVVQRKATSPGASCATRPSVCTSRGRFVDCEENDDEVRFYCIPYEEFWDNPTDPCAGIASYTPLFESKLRNESRAGSVCTGEPPEVECKGQLHCCETPAGEGSVRADYYCVVPYCIDPPDTGRIRRVVQ